MNEEDNFFKDIISIRKNYNYTKVFTCLGASNHTDKERQQEDYYATDPKATELLLEQEEFNPNIWECAVGGWHIGNVLKQNGYNVFGTDIIDRGGGDTKIYDFLNDNSITEFDGDIITNPPYKCGPDFVKKALEIIPIGNKIAMFLKLTFLESKSRKDFFLKNPPKVLYVSSSRIICAMNGDFDKYTSSAVAYAWYVWEKGFKGDTIIKWIN